MQLAPLVPDADKCRSQQRFQYLLRDNTLVARPLRKRKSLLYAPLDGAKAALL
jgi:hypothetical protein